MLRSGGRVRGTPAQLVEKYLGFAKDARLANDRAAAETAPQFAKHYTRILRKVQQTI